MKRRRPSTPPLGMQIEILFRRCFIACAECGERIEKPKDAQWDHRVEHADGGEHSVENIGPVHGPELGCHKRKSAMSTTQRARINRLEEARKPPVPAGELTYTKRVFEKRKPKIAPRPFQKAPEGFTYFRRRSA